MAPPAGGIIDCRQQVFSAPGHTVQGTAIQAALNLAVGAIRLLVGKRFGVAGDTVKNGIVTLEAREVHLGQLARCNLSRAQQLSQLRQREKGDVFEVFRAGNGQTAG